MPMHPMQERPQSAKTKLKTPCRPHAPRAEKGFGRGNNMKSRSRSMM